MSGKPKKKDAVPKAEEVLEEPIQTEEAADDFVDETFEEDVPKTKDKKSSKKGDAEPKKKKSRNGFRLSSIDPIILVSFTIFMVSCLIVTGVTIYGIVAGDSSAKVCEYGDSVEVNYTGSYFNYYDGQNITVFDTTMSFVGDSDTYAKSYEYTKKDSYTPLAFTAGQGSYLQEFRDAVIGHKPGDIIRIEIVDGYGSLTEGEDMFTIAKAGNTVGKVIENLTVDKYKELFDVDDVPDVGYPVVVESPYGWNARVTHNSNDTIAVENLAVAGDTYDVSNGLQIKVNTVGETIGFDYVIEPFSKNTNMVRAMYYDDATNDFSKIYIIASDSNGDMTYKTTDEKTGITLYFVIEFVGYSS